MPNPLLPRVFSDTATANSLTPGEMWQKKEVDSSDQQGGEHDTSGQEDPKLEMFVEVGPVMNALDQIGTTESHVQNLGRLGIDLDLIAVLAPHFNHALAGPYVQSVNIFPRLNLCLWDGFHYLENAIKSDCRFCPGTALGRRLDVR